MDLYDGEIRKLISMLESHGVKRLPLQKEWEMTEKENLILKSEMAYELGGGSNLDFARKILDYTTEVSAIEIKLKPGADISGMISHMQELL